MTNGLALASTTSQDPMTENSEIDLLLTVLVGLFQEEESPILSTTTQIRDQIVKQLATMTLIQAMKKVLAISADLILKPMTIVINKLLEIIAILAEGLLNFLDSPVSIPILSPMYKRITRGSELSMLDLLCLVCAIPVTIIGKATSGRVPFLDNPQTQALVTAKDFAAIQAVFKTTHKSSSAGKICLLEEGTDNVRAPHALQLNPASVSIAGASMQVAASIATGMYVFFKFRGANIARRLVEDFGNSASNSISPLN